MYGKKFVAALLFLAVADVDFLTVTAIAPIATVVNISVGADSNYMFDPAPAPESYHADEDGTVVDFPSDGWDFYRAVFHLHEIDVDLTDFLDNLPEEYADYAPTDYVMKGEIYHNNDGAYKGIEIGVGLAHESWEEGILAGYDRDGDYRPEGDFLPFVTLVFNVDEMLAADYET